ncbi:MAG: hypothetical protein V1691_02140 [Chloroflexota bacterium]
MVELDNRLTSSGAKSAGDAEALRHLEQAIGSGQHWYIALLGAMGLWGSAEETYDGQAYHYLIGGEAFDWLLLAERLCRQINGLLPDMERDALVFHGRPPLNLSQAEVKGLIGSSKYGQYLNYFYGVTVEGVLLMAVKEEIHKERQLLSCLDEHETGEEAYRRVYGESGTVLLKRFHQETGYFQPRSATLAELKEFTYWLFKYRLRHCERAKVASDTRKALNYLRHQWDRKGFFGALSVGEPPAESL